MSTHEYWRNGNVAVARLFISSGGNPVKTGEIFKLAAGVGTCLLCGGPIQEGICGLAGPRTVSPV